MLGTVLASLSAIIIVYFVLKYIGSSDAKTAHYILANDGTFVDKAETATITRQVPGIEFIYRVRFINAEPVIGSFKLTAAEATPETIRDHLNEHTKFDAKAERLVLADVLEVCVIQRNEITMSIQEYVRKDKAAG